MNRKVNHVSKMIIFLNCTQQLRNKCFFSMNFYVPETLKTLLLINESNNEVTYFIICIQELWNQSSLTNIMQKSSVEIDIKIFGYYCISKRQLFTDVLQNGCPEIFLVGPKKTPVPATCIFEKKTLVCI